MIDTYDMKKFTLITCICAAF